MQSSYVLGLKSAPLRRLKLIARWQLPWTSSGEHSAERGIASYRESYGDVEGEGVILLPIPYLRGLPPARVLRIAAIWAKYSGPRFAVCFPPFAPNKAAAAAGA